jgi:hypothetical protein
MKGTRVCRRGRERRGEGKRKEKKWERQHSSTSFFVIILNMSNCRGIANKYAVNEKVFSWVQ